MKKPPQHEGAYFRMVGWELEVVPLCIGDRRADLTTAGEVFAYMRRQDNPSVPGGKLLLVYVPGFNLN